MEQGWVCYSWRTRERYSTRIYGIYTVGASEFQYRSNYVPGGTEPLHCQCLVNSGVKNGKSFPGMLINFYIDLRESNHSPSYQPILTLMWISRWIKRKSLKKIYVNNSHFHRPSLTSPRSVEWHTGTTPRTCYESHKDLFHQKNVRHQ